MLKSPIRSVNYFDREEGYKEAFCLELGHIRDENAVNEIANKLKAGSDRFEVLIGAACVDGDAVRTVQILYKKAADESEEDFLRIYSLKLIGAI